MSGDLNRAVDLSVYFKANTPVVQAEQVATAIRMRKGVATVRLITSDEAVKAFRERSGFGTALDALTDNPLPHALVVSPASDATSRPQLDALAEAVRSMAGVDIVQLDTVWVERFNAILDAVRRGVLVIAMLLSFGVMVIVGNTIRTEIQSRRAEIEIIKLVGGTDAFVRRPFLYTGIWYGLGGGLVALSVSYLIVALMSGPISRLAGLYGSDFALAGLGLRYSLWLIAAGLALGWLGSLVSASRHLRDIQPQ
jgi:cell division transport system permease protein